MLSLCVCCHSRRRQGKELLALPDGLVDLQSLKLIKGKEKAIRGHFLSHFQDSDSRRESCLREGQKQDPRSTTRTELGNEKEEDVFIINANRIKKYARKKEQAIETNKCVTQTEVVSRI